MEQNKNDKNAINQKTSTEDDSRFGYKGEAEKQHSISSTIDDYYKEDDKKLTREEILKREEMEKPVEGIVENINAESKNFIVAEKEGAGNKYFSGIGKKNGILKLAAMAVGIMSVAVIGYAALNVTNIKKEETPQQIIKSSLKTTSKVKTYEFNGNMKISALIKPKLTDTLQNSYPQDLNFTYNIKMSGKADQTDINNPKTSGNIKLDMDFLGEGGSQAFNLDLDVMSFGQKATYYKLNDYDLGIIGMMIGPQISQYKGKWYMLDMEKMKKSAGADNSMLYNSFGMNNYDVNKIKKIYERYELMKFQKDLDNTKLGAIDVYHYQLKIDGIALANFYMDLLKETQPKDNNEISKKDFEEILKEIKTGIEKHKNLIDKIANNINIEVWIGKNDRLIYKVKIDGKFDKKFLEMIEEEIIAKEKDLGPEMLEDRLSKSIDEANIDFDMYFNMSDFNKPVGIEEPKEAESLLKVFEEMGGGLSPYNNPYDSTPGSDLDKDGLTDTMEEFYGTDKNNPDTDGDEHKDGEEVNNGYDPLLPGDAKLDYEKLFKK